MKVHVYTLVFESQTSTNKLTAPSAYQGSSERMKTLNKFNFIKIVFVSISIHRDLVLKLKLVHFVRADFLPLKHISLFSTPPSFDSTVITLSRDIVRMFEILTFAGKKLTVLLYPQTDIIRQANYFCFLLLTFSCFLMGYLISQDHIASFYCC